MIKYLISFIFIIYHLHMMDGSVFSLGLIRIYDLT